MNYVEQIKEAIKDKKLVVGTKSVMRSLKNKELSDIFMASNVDEKTKSSIEKYATISSTKIKMVSEDSVSLGTICKKPFSIVVCGLKVKK
ncbi:MAG: ribosomal L7Ae/L30e/S12e/Gadd45 family protein [Candidatus Nanoarchaeia archaeon]|nr:ribosomal L7Ae/L30e/S12e/Gadd45 family protein [Candidatus Nanoarchaeia archaeon]